MELAKQMLAESVGADRAEEIMERLGATLAEMPFEACAAPTRASS